MIYMTNAERLKYFVKAEFFTLGHQIHVYDCNNNEVGGVYQKPFRFLPEFEVEISGRSIGIIKKEFSFFKPRYNIDYNGWHVEEIFSVGIMTCMTETERYCIFQSSFSDGEIHM